MLRSSAGFLVTADVDVGGERPRFIVAGGRKVSKRER
jgi:hypothetical protein